MAKILPSDLHPAEEVLFGLGQGESFTLKGQNKTASFETDNASTVLEARVHPWLVVEEDAPAEQPEAEAVEVVQPVAIDAGKNQNEAVVSGGIAETLASGAEAKVEEVPADQTPVEPDDLFEDTNE